MFYLVTRDAQGVPSSPLATWPLPGQAQAAALPIAMAAAAQRQSLVIEVHRACLTEEDALCWRPEEEADPFCDDGPLFPEQCDYCQGRGTYVAKGADQACLLCNGTGIRQ